MNIPKLYQIKSLKQKHKIVKNIVDALSSINLNDYPNISNQLSNDYSKVSLMNMIIINMYSEESGVVSIENSISSIEVTLN
tara:strand:- start:8120 stop:8362 length:243 start_codon:yes stop_codon:yes gene_type:complete